MTVVSVVSTDEAPEPVPGVGTAVTRVSAGSVPVASPLLLSLVLSLLLPLPSRPGRGRRLGEALSPPSVPVPVVLLDRPGRGWRVPAPDSEPVFVPVPVVPLVRPGKGWRAPAPDSEPVPVPVPVPVPAPPVGSGVRLLLVPLAKTKPWLGATNEEGPEAWATAGSAEGLATMGTKEPMAAAVVVPESTASVATLSTAEAELATIGVKAPGAAPATEVATTADVAASAAPAAVVDPPTTWVNEPIT